MAHKKPNKPSKGKGGGGGKSGGGGGGGKRPQPPQQPRDDARDAPQPAPQELVAEVRPYFESLTQEQRAQELTLGLAELRERARALSEAARAQAVEAGDVVGAELSAEASLEEVLEEGLRRMHERGTWKVWQFDGREFEDAEAFRAHVHDGKLPPELRALLPKDDARAPERPAEAALRQRMTDLLARVQAIQGRGLAEEEAPAQQPQPRGACSPLSLQPFLALPCLSACPVVVGCTCLLMTCCLWLHSSLRRVSDPSVLPSFSPNNNTKHYMQAAATACATASPPTAPPPRATPRPRSSAP